MPPYGIRLTKEALKDLKKHPPRLKKKLKEILINRVALEPYTGKKLLGDLQAFYSIRLTYQDRIVYSIDEELKIVFVHRVKTHYGDWVARVGLEYQTLSINQTWLAGILLKMVPAGLQKVCLGRAKGNTEKAYLAADGRIWAQMKALNQKQPAFGISG